jgi:hypothetical protein
MRRQITYSRGLNEHRPCTTTVLRRLPTIRVLEASIDVNSTVVSTLARSRPNRYTFIEPLSHTQSPGSEAIRNHRGKGWQEEVHLCAVSSERHNRTVPASSQRLPRHAKPTELSQARNAFLAPSCRQPRSSDRQEVLRRIRAADANRQGVA